MELKKASGRPTTRKDLERRPLLTNLSTWVTGKTT